MPFPSNESTNPNQAGDEATAAMARSGLDGADDATGALPAHPVENHGADAPTGLIDTDGPTGRAAENAADQEAWRVGSRYRVVGRLGSGGMADVFRAHDELLARDVAVKVFRAQPQAPETETSGNRQLAELHALARLNHPNLITLFDGSIAETDGPAYLVMELIDGATLADRIAQGPLPHAEVRELGAQIAAALAYVHAQGMVHRDVKPANILLGVDRTDEGATLRARLSDFGIVRLLGTERMTSVDFTLGTASYLAPEQARGADVGPPADVYSLGLVLIEALSGVRSFDGSPLEAALARLDRDPEIPADLPAAWTSLLGAMTAREPGARPTASQVGQLLRGETQTSSALPLLGDADAATHALRIPGAVPVGAAVGAGLAAAPASAQSGPGRADDEFDHPARDGRGRLFAWLAVAAVALAAIVLGGVMVLRPSAPADSSTPTSGSSTGAAATTGTARSRATKAVTGVSPVSVDTTTSRRSSAASSAAASSSAARSTPAPASSAAPRSSAAAPPPIGSTSAGVPTSAAPATSSAAPPATSAPPTSATPSAPANNAASSSAVALPSGP